MPKRIALDETRGLAAGDPRRPIKVRRLREERERIAGFQGRSPSLDDADFDEWENTVQSLLREVFGASEFLLRFRQLHIRPISYQMGGHRQWYADPGEAWSTGLKHADKILAEAIEEAEVELPLASASDSATKRPAPNIVVTVQNQNVFSPSVHVTVNQLIERLNSMGLSTAEKDVATEHLNELQAETEGQGRWPIIAKSLEAMKSVGKLVYKEVAVPLIVEFLKKEAGLGPH